VCLFFPSACRGVASAARVIASATAGDDRELVRYCSRQVPLHHHWRLAQPPGRVPVAAAAAVVVAAAAAVVVAAAAAVVVAAAAVVPAALDWLAAIGVAIAVCVASSHVDFATAVVVVTTSRGVWIFVDGRADVVLHKREPRFAW
jgi:hypothetical protein